MVVAALPGAWPSLWTGQHAVQSCCRWVPRLQSRSNSLLGGVGGIVGVKHGEGGCHHNPGAEATAMLLWILPKPVHMPSCQSLCRCPPQPAQPQGPSGKGGAAMGDACCLQNRRVGCRFPAQIQVPPVGSRQCWEAWAREVEGQACPAGLHAAWPPCPGFGKWAERNISYVFCPALDFLEAEGNVVYK